MNFLMAMANVIFFAFGGTLITFSKDGGANIKSKQFSEFGSWTNSVIIRC